MSKKEEWGLSQAHWGEFRRVRNGMILSEKKFALLMWNRKREILEEIAT